MVSGIAKTKKSTRVTLYSALAFTGLIVPVLMYDFLVRDVYATIDFGKCFLLDLFLWVLWIFTAIKNDDMTYCLEKIGLKKKKEKKAEDTSMETSSVTKISALAMYICAAIASFSIVVGIIRMFFVNFFPAVPNKNWVLIGIVFAAASFIAYKATECMDIIDEEIDESEYYYDEEDEEDDEEDEEE